VLGPLSQQAVKLEILDIKTLFSNSFAIRPKTDVITSQGIFTQKATKTHIQPDS